MKKSKAKALRSRYRRRIANFTRLSNMTCLIVVDMQIDQPAAVIKKANLVVWKIIREMIKQKQVIVFMNYQIKRNGCFEEYPTIATFEERNIDLLEEYMNKYPDNVIFLRKNSDDGSQIIFDEVRVEKIKKFEIVGVNTEHCVIDTAVGLAHKMPDKKIIIRHEGCNSNPFSGETQYNIIREIARKIVIAKTDNIHLEHKGYNMIGVPASYIHNKMSDEGLEEQLKQVFICHRVNALEEKAGEKSCCFRDSSIRIYVLDDVNMGKILRHHESGKVGKIHHHCALQVLNHPNYPESEVYQADESI